MSLSDNLFALLMPQLQEIARTYQLRRVSGLRKQPLIEALIEEIPAPSLQKEIRKYVRQTGRAGRISPRRPISRIYLIEGLVVLKVSDLRTIAGMYELKIPARIRKAGKAALIDFLIENLTPAQLRREIRFYRATSE